MVQVTFNLPVNGLEIVKKPEIIAHNLLAKFTDKVYSNKTIKAVLTSRKHQKS